MAHRWVWLLNDSDMSKAAAYTKPAVDAVQGYANRAASKAQFAMVAHRDQGYMNIDVIHRGQGPSLDSYIILRDPDPDKGRSRNRNRNGSAISFELGYTHKSGTKVDGAGVLANAVGGL